MDLGLKHKRALVFGAGSGLGKAAALALAAEGASVILAGRTKEKLEATQKEIAALGGISHCMVWDVGELGKITDRISEAQSLLGGSIEILFNNGGGPPPTPAQGQPQDLWRSHFESMVLSIIAITDAVLPAMRENKWGRILTNTSSGVIAPISGLALSNSLRGSLVGWSKTLSAEVARDGITVNIVIPGRIETERTSFLDAARAKREGKTTEQVFQEASRAIAMGRYGRPSEYGDVVAFLASERASYVTGSMIRVDGGAITSV